MRSRARHSRGESRERETGARARRPRSCLSRALEAAAWDVERALSWREAEAGRRAPRRPRGGARP